MTVKEAVTGCLREGGWGWVVVAASFCITLISFGIPFSIGIIFDVITEEFACTKSEVSAVGSIALSVQCLFGPVASLIQHQIQVRLTVIIGCILTSVSFITSALFADNLVTLYFTFGFIGGIGISLIFVPMAVLVSLHFGPKRQSLATGISYLGTYFGCIVLPYLIRFLVSLYNWRGALFVLGALQLNSLAFALLLRPAPLHMLEDQPVDPKADSSETEKQQPDAVVKVELAPNGTGESSDGTRRTPSQGSNEQNFNQIIKTLRKLIRNKKFLSFAASNLLLGSFYHLSPLFIVGWGMQLGIPTDRITLLMSLLGTGNICGRMVLAVLSDCFFRHRLLTLALLIGLNGVLTVVTPFVASFHYLAFYMFQSAFLLGGGRTTLAPALRDMVSAADMPMSFGLLVAAEGCGILLGPPLLGLLPTYELIFLTAGLIMLTSAVNLFMNANAKSLINFLKKCRPLAKSNNQDKNAEKGDVSGTETPKL